MRWTFNVIILINLCFSVCANAGQLNEDKLKKFSQQLFKETIDSPKKIYPYLSNKLEVEASIGSTVWGLTYFYDKEQYVQFIEQRADSLVAITKDADFDIYNFIVTSPSQGKFTVCAYLNAVNKKIWTDYFVEVKNGHLKIVKIIEADDS